MVGMKTLTLDVSYLTFISSSALPLVTGFVTKCAASSRVKHATLAVLAILAGLVQALIAKHGVIEWHSFVDNTVVSYVVAVTLHTTAFKTTGLTEKIAQAAPNFGIGVAQPAAVNVVDIVPTPETSRLEYELAQRLGLVQR